MSLVNYDSSSDEDVNNDIVETEKNLESEAEERRTMNACGDIKKRLNSTDNVLNNITTELPKPSKSDKFQGIFSDLPSPMLCKNNETVEEDDEFLHKKNRADKLLRAGAKRRLVKISIPSLKDFSDVNEELGAKAQNKVKSLSVKSKSSGLLSILPKVKSEQSLSTLHADCKNIKMSPFIPDVIRTNRCSLNTEEDGIRPKQNKTKKYHTALVATAAERDSEDEDNNKDSADFFCIENKHQLPEINVKEIQAMVAKKSKKILETTTKFLNEWPSKNLNEIPESNEENLIHIRGLDSQAIQALVGSSVKRNRHEIKNIEMTDISSEEIFPNRDEWMRTALASTGYQPTGVLVDEEPSSGTRRKHQITYLAHKAKANEAELQAMWATNRQNRRATQSKYGF